MSLTKNPSPAIVLEADFQLEAGCMAGWLLQAIAYKADDERDDDDDD